MRLHDNTCASLASTDATGVAAGGFAVPLRLRVQLRQMRTCMRAALRALRVAF